MKIWFLFMVLISATAVSAKPVVLVSYYDPFGRADFNNSERVAKAVKERLRNSEISIKLCPLNTVFDKSYMQLESCLNALDQRPTMVVGLGEAGCNLKFEVTARNSDKTFGPDNEGNEREAVIIPGAPDFLAMRWPLPQMYCGLDKKSRGSIEISNNAGSFVCNNTAYQINYNYPDIMFGFAHVPAGSCRLLKKKTEFAVNSLSTMILKGVQFLSKHFTISPETPHTSNNIRLPLLRDDIYDLRMSFKEQDQCIYDFFNDYPGIDE